MKKRRLISIAVVGGLIIAMGALYADGLGGMGFELNLLLEERTPGISATGQTQVGLPYIPKSSIVTVSDLRDDINATAGTPSSTCLPESTCALVAISRFVKTDDSFQTYTGGPTDLGVNYIIDGVEGQRIQVRYRVNYTIVGSHDPGRIVYLDAQGTNGSATGQTEFSFPYHGTSTDVWALRDEINFMSASGNAVVAIAQFVGSDDSFQTYTGGVVSNFNFPLVPGHSYRVQVVEDVAYVPSHF